jgi:hypothetical protein
MGKQHFENWVGHAKNRVLGRFLKEQDYEQYESPRTACQHT